MLKVEYIDESQLKPHPENPRKIDQEQMNVLCQSLKDNPDFFEARPILCNKDMVVFAGNMRLLAARRIGLKQVPVIVMDISEARQRELMIRDNVSNGQWQWDLLSGQFDIEELNRWGLSDKVLLGESSAGDVELPSGEGGAGKSVTCPKCGHEFTA